MKVEEGGSVEARDVMFLYQGISVNSGYLRHEIGNVRVVRTSHVPRRPVCIGRDFNLRVLVTTVRCGIECARQQQQCAERQP